MKYFQGHMDNRTVRLLDIDRMSEAERESNGGMEKEELQLPQTLDDFKRELSTGLSMRPRIPAVPMEVVKEITQAHVHASRLLAPMDEWLMYQKKEIVRNADKLKKEIFANMESGYAEKVYPLRDEIRKLLADEKKKERCFLVRLEEAKMTFVNSRNSLFKRHVEEEAYEEYLHEIVNYYKYKVNLMLCEQMLEVVYFVEPC